MSTDETPKSTAAWRESCTKVIIPSEVLNIVYYMYFPLLKAYCNVYYMQTALNPQSKLSSSINAATFLNFL